MRMIIENDDMIMCFKINRKVKIKCYVRFKD